MIARFLTVNALGSLALNIASQGLGFIFFIMLARLLGVNDFGLYVLAWGWVRIMLNLAKAGFDVSATRFLPGFIAAQDWGRFHRYWRYSHRAILICSIICALMCSAVVVVLNAADLIEQPLIFILAFAVLPLWAVTLYHQSVLRAQKKIIAGLYIDSLVRPGLQLVLLIGLPAIGFTQDAMTAMTMTLVAFACAAAMSSLHDILSVRFLPRSKDIQESTSTEHTEWRHMAMTITLMASGVIIMKQADIVMIGALLNTEATGLYSAASRIAALAGFVLMAVNLVAGPLISGYHKKENHAAMQRMLSMSATLITMGTFSIALGLWLFDDVILSLYGEAFAHSKTAMHILLLGYVVNALTGPVGYVMMMTGHHVRAAQIYGSMIVVNIALNAGLIPILGIEGASIATTITMICVNLVLCVYVWQRLGYNTTILPLNLRQHDV